MDNKKTHKTSVGGQALIEGVMMQGPRGIATAVRKADGDIVVKHHEFSHIRDKHKFWGLPVIRGMVNFVESMILGYKMLMYSAEASGMEDLEDVEMNKFENGLQINSAINLWISLWALLLFWALRLLLLYSFIFRFLRLTNLIKLAPVR